MKSTYIAFLAILLATAFSGCGNSSKDQTSELSPNEPQSDREIDSIERLLPSLKDDSTKIHVLHRLSSHYGTQDIEKAKKYAQEGIDLALQVASKYGNDGVRLTAGMYKCMGICLADNGEVGKALPYFRQAEQIESTVADIFPSSYLRTKINLATAYSFAQKSDSALILFEESIKFAINSNELQKLIIIYINMGQIFFNRYNNFDLAIDYYQKADSLNKLLNLSDDDALWINWGNALRGKHEYDKALQMYKKSLNSKNLNYKFSANIDASIIFIDMNAFDSARVYQRKALAIAQKMKNENYLRGAYNTDINIERKYCRINNIKVPDSLLSKINNMKGEDQGVYQSRLVAFKLKLFAAKERGDGKALGAIYDSILRITTAQYDETIAQSVVSAEGRLRLREQQAAAADSLHRKQLQLSWALAGLLSLLGGVSVFIFLNGRLRRQRATIAAQAKRLEILNESISHNAKNDLNLLQTLAGQAVNSGSPDDLEAVLRYIKTVKAVRQLTDAGGDSPAQLVPAYLIPVLLRMHPRPVRTQLDLDDVPPLPEKQGLWLAQILNEFLTNAHKHAFDQHPDPELYISCRMHNGQYELIFADNGPGLPADRTIATDKQRGLGLIQGYVHSLGGTLITENSPAGLSYTLRFPLMG